MAYTGTLTAADLERVAASQAEWMAAALSTERCDRSAAERAVAGAYTAAGLPEPAFVWMDSPLGGAFAAAFLKGALKGEPGQLGGQLGDQLGGQLGDQLRGQLGDQLRGQLGDQLWDQLRGQLGGQLRDQLRDQLGDQLRGQLGDQLRGQLRGQLGGQLRGQLWDQLRDQLRDQLWDQLRDQLWDQLGGQLRGQLWDQLGYEMSGWSDAYWMALYGNALGIAGIEPSPRLNRLTEAAKLLGWWWPLQGAAILTDRPTLISRDQQGRLHNSTGPAITYSDGYTLTAWHGVRVPEDFHTWNLERVLSERNTEIRRCGIERLGWDQVEAQLIKVAEADDPGNPPHKLSLYDLPKSMTDLYDAHARILIVRNGSVDKGGARRTFGLPVEGHQTDPVAAAASLFGVPKAAYAALARRT